MNNTHILFEEKQMKKRVLAIDDEEMTLEALRTILEDLGCAIDTFTDPVEGKKRALEDDYDLILLDIRMPGRNGAEIAESILAEKPNASVLIITAHPNDPYAKRALEAGALSLVKKPFEIAKIMDFLQ
jgi:DNA-binding response OmpR family regulator